MRKPVLRGEGRQEDVKKLISLSFRDFIFDPKCLPTSLRSLIRHPGAIFLTPSSLQILKSIFSHLPGPVSYQPLYYRPLPFPSTGHSASRQPQPKYSKSYLAFLACHYNSSIEQITEEEDGQAPAYFAVIDSLAVIGATGRLGPWGVVPVAGAALSHIGVGVKANIECTESVYGPH
jgi:hypothetical protein